MGYWIFRGNREDFKIDAYLEKFDYIYWSVKQHQSEINVDDKVFIWRSKGESKVPYGIVAFGTVVEARTHKDKVRNPLFLGDGYLIKNEVSPFKIGIQLHGIRLDLENGLIDSSLLLADVELAKMQLLTARRGTNFKLTEYQFNKIYQLWDGVKSDPEEDEYETEEGKARLRVHKVRERDATLVKKAKDKFLKKNASLYCEACDFSFSVVYGIEYIEAHHKKPLNKIKAGEKTKESDLGMLCANCHRAVHRIKSVDSWRDLLKLHGKL